MQVSEELILQGTITQQQVFINNFKFIHSICVYLSITSQLFIAYVCIYHQQLQLCIAYVCIDYLTSDLVKMHVFLQKHFYESYL